MDASRLRNWGPLRTEARAQSSSPTTNRTSAASTHLRHGRPHRIRGWALVRWAGARLAQRRYLRLVHYSLTVFDGADENVDLVLLEQVLVGTKVHWNARKHEIVIRTQDKDKIVVTVRTSKEFDAWKVGFADAAREPAQYYTLVQSRKLGAGAFSEVFFGFDRDSGDHAAIKVVDKTQCTRVELEHAQTEARVMAFVRHPAVIACRDIFDGPDSLHVVMEFMAGGTLEDRVRDLLRNMGHVPEAIAATVLANVLSALVYLESEGICHRDVKPDNILIGVPSQTSSTPSSDLWATTVRLSDFGLAAFVDSRNGTLLTDFVGTPHFVAPEVLARSADNSRVGYGCTVDVWAVGIMAYWMLSGDLPFDGADSSAVCRSIRDGDLSFDSPSWAHVSSHGRSFVRSLLQPAPHTRLTAAAALTHPWMLHSHGERSLAVAAATATAFAISRAGGPLGPASGSVFKRRRLTPGALVRVAVFAVLAANRLYRLVLQTSLAPLVARPPQAPPSSTSGQSPLPTDAMPVSAIKRPLTKKQSADRMLAAPERAPVGTDGLGYNVGLFRSFAPKQRQRASGPETTQPSALKSDFGSFPGVSSSGSLSLTYGRRSAPLAETRHVPLRKAASTVMAVSRSGFDPSSIHARDSAETRLRPLAQRAKSLNARSTHRRRGREEGSSGTAAR